MARSKEVRHRLWRGYAGLSVLLLPKDANDLACAIHSGHFTPSGDSVGPIWQERRQVRCCVFAFVQQSLSEQKAAGGIPRSLAHCVVLELRRLCFSLAHTFDFHLARTVT